MNVLDEHGVLAIVAIIILIGCAVLLAGPQTEGPPQIVKPIPWWMAL